jgi:cytochrome b561
MKKFLPFLLLLIITAQLLFIPPVFAQVATGSGNTTNSSTASPRTSTEQPADGAWVNDSDVTFVGKMGARSGQFLDWTLQNYSWSFVTPGTQNPLAQFWAQIRNIVYAFFALAVLITAFIMIITRGRSITVMRFIPRFIIIILLVTFSFALIQFLYQITDVIQSFFLRNPEGTGFISQKNLLNIGFNYEDFIGYRRFGANFDESAFISLLLVKLTAATYYVMAGILLIRKIILWFFIIISPVFPLLLLYAPIRNTGKIWIGEFFRWLLYAPIFAIFLSGLVYVWRTGIPLQFAFTKAVVYPTAINILLGGPGQVLSLSNSVNNKETFALYVVALLMLWVIIILPFLLLQIFLDYIQTLSLSENSFVKQIVESGSSFMSKPRGSSSIPPPAGIQPAGMAKTIPFAAKISIPNIKSQSIPIDISNLRSMESEITKLTNLSVPTMRDIAKFETASISSSMSKHAELAKYHETLEKISNPGKLSSTIERQKYTSIKDKLVSEGQKGNRVASSILTAANTINKPEKVVESQKETVSLNTALQKISNPDTANITEKQKLTTIKDQLIKAQEKGDPLATSVLNAMDKEGADEALKQKLKEAKEKGNSIAAMVLEEAGVTDISQVSSGPFPVSNRVQQVSFDDYEAVRKMWEENYETLEPPKQQQRAEWINSDIGKITETVNLLSSQDPQNVNKGMEAVGNILPFLLIGGFSQTEVVAYLKAKLEAAKSIAGKLKGKQEEEETMVSAKTKKDEKPKKMKEEIAIDEKPKKEFS